LEVLKKETQSNNNISIQQNYTKQVISVHQNIVYDKHHFFQHIRKSFLKDLKNHWKDSSLLDQLHYL